MYAASFANNDVLFIENIDTKNCADQLLLYIYTILCYIYDNMIDCTRCACFPRRKKKPISVFIDRNGPRNFLRS